MKKFGLLVSAALFALGCGGLDDVLGPADAGVCGAGVTPFQISTSPLGTMNYAVVSGSTSTVTTDCTNVDPAAAQTSLSTAARGVANNNGNICVTAVGTAPGSSVNLGCGDVRCNMGTLTNSYAFTDNTKCNWINTNTVDMTVTGPKQMKICLKQVRSAFMSISAGSCTQTKDCTVSWCQTIAAP